MVHSAADALDCTRAPLPDGLSRRCDSARPGLRAAFEGAVRMGSSAHPWHAVRCWSWWWISRCGCMLMPSPASLLRPLHFVFLSVPDQEVPEEAAAARLHPCDRPHQERLFPALLQLPQLGGPGGRRVKRPPFAVQTNGHGRAAQRLAARRNAAHSRGHSIVHSSTGDHAAHAGGCIKCLRYSNNRNITSLNNSRLFCCLAV